MIGNCGFKVSLVVFLAIFSLCYGFGQNLVKNPSFEEYLECPNTLGTFNAHTKHWSTPTNGSTDYFNKCSKVMGAPENFNGTQNPRFGDAYAGLYFFAPGDYREYIQVQLKRTLRKGKSYKLSFYISLAEGSDFAVKDFGAVFSYKSIQVETKKELSKGRLYQMKGNKFHSKEINHPEFHEDKTDWLKVEVVIEAKGYENYLTLGNLRDNSKTRKIQTKRKETKKGAYYYIDMVSLTAEDNLLEPAAPIHKDTLYTFKNIHFDFDRFSLDEKAKTELSSVRTKMIKNPQLLLAIHGHTDNLGSQSYNKKLSEKRAKVLANYFIASGIKPQRITWFGHGSSKPKANNSSEKGRAQNRRAEFLFKNGGQ